MKKRIFAVLLAAAMTFSLAACGGSAGEKTDEPAQEESGDAEGEDTEDSGDTGAPEQSVVKWNCGTSGNVLLTIAEAKGYLEDEGISIEYVQANANADAMTLLAVSNAATSNPLQQIASGVDLTIFGGHMVEGCMPGDFIRYDYGDYDN